AQVGARGRGLPGGLAMGRSALRKRRVTIRSIAVLGAGIMGRGIAYASALAGYDTALQDVERPALDHARAEIASLLDKGAAAGEAESATAESAKRRLRTVATLDEAAPSVDLVIEAVPEDMRLKLEIFAALERLVPAHALLASNTSSLSITEMAGATRNPARVVGMHFFNPVHRMKLLEVVRALETSDAAVAAAIEVGGRMGKECVVVRE